MKIKKGENENQKEKEWEKGEEKKWVKKGKEERIWLVLSIKV